MIDLRPLGESDVAAHNAGEDAAVVQWLTGSPATWDSTLRHFRVLALNAERGVGKRGFGVWLYDELAGYVDFDLDGPDLPESGDVNIAYAVHPWARRRGVATAAVLLLCERLRHIGPAKRAIIRTHPSNISSIGVARACGFRLVSAPGVGPTCKVCVSVDDLIFVLDLEAPGDGEKSSPWTPAS